jgi:hypothetical protein
MQWLTTKKEIDRYFEARHSRKRWLNFFNRMLKFAKIRAGHRCEHCGRPEGFKIRCHILTVCHLDGDDTNWEPENLAAVCWLCYWRLEKHRDQLALPGLDHPLDRLRRLRTHPQTSGPGSHAQRSSGSACHCEEPKRRSNLHSCGKR